MFEGWNIVVLGVMGVVGEVLFEIFVECQFLVGEIFVLVCNDSVGEYLCFGGKLVIVKDVVEFDWIQVQLVFFVVGVEVSVVYVEEVINVGCLVIDFSGLFVLELDVLLVVLDVNLFVLGDYCNCNLIVVFNSLISQLLMVFKLLIDQGGLLCISVINLFFVLGQGKKVVDVLVGQSVKLLNGIFIDEDDFFGCQLVFNMLLLLLDCEGSVCEECWIVDEVCKIFQDDGLMIFVSVVQLLVFYGYVQMVSFEVMCLLVVEEVCDVFICGEDIEFFEEGEFLIQVGDVLGNVCFFIGCVYNDYGMLEQIQFWLVVDNVCFGGVLMVVKIVEKLIEEYLY